MEIQYIGIDFRHPADFGIHRPRGSGDYLVLIVNSPAYFSFGGKEQLVAPGTVVVYKKGTPQMYRAAGEEYRNDWFHFEPTVGEISFMDALGIPYDTPTPCGDTAQLSELIKCLYRENFSANGHKAKSIDLYFKLLMLKISECTRQSDPEHSLPHYEKLSRLRGDIYNAPQVEYTVSSVAERLSLSESYLQHLYRRVFGVSMTADVITARIDRAKYLLSGTAYTVSAIAHMCGYNSDVHFMRQFKTLCGVTPSEYRRRFSSPPKP